MSLKDGIMMSREGGSTIIKFFDKMGPLSTSEISTASFSNRIMLSCFITLANLSV